jgi:hypothetical protein
MADHYHCPYECEHPQPLRTADGRYLCGRCWVLDDEQVDMQLCTPETCPNEGTET